MIKKIIIFGLVIFILGALGYVYIKFVNPKVISDIKTNLKKYNDQITLVSWDDVISGNLSNSLNNDQNQGRFSEISSNIVPIQKYRYPNPLFLKNYSFGYIELFLADVKLGAYQDSSKQPYETVSTFKTNINGEGYYLIIQRWVNNDNSIIFLPIITSDLTYYSDFVENSSQFFPSPIVEIKDIETCLELKGAGREYCNWYFENVTSYNVIKDKWLLNSIIPTEIAKYPILVTKTKLKI